MIREATLNDLRFMLYLGRDMFVESRFAQDFTFNGAKVLAAFQHYICDPNGIALLSDHGMLLASVQPHWFADELMAEDRIIYVHPDYRRSREGIALIRAYVQRARELGAVEVHISNATGINTERVEHLYERMGFQRFGGNYVMEREHGLSK